MVHVLTHLLVVCRAPPFIRLPPQSQLLLLLLLLDLRGDGCGDGGGGDLDGGEGAILVGDLHLQRGGRGPLRDGRRRRLRLLSRRCYDDSQERITGNRVGRQRVGNVLLVG